MINTAKKQGPEKFGTLPEFAKVASRPRTIAESGLSETLIRELIIKHLYSAGALSKQALSDRIALAGAIVEPLVDLLRREARVEIRTATDGAHYVLTDKGRAMALDALMRSGYVGPAPVPVEMYTRLAKFQSVEKKFVNREKMRQAFSDVVVSDELLDKLGPAVVSGRAIFVYGPAGTGKTYLTQRLQRLFGDTILVPYALAANETIIEYFDPLLHRQVSTEASSTSVLLEEGHDPRYLRCKRPIVMAGGELTLDMLELAHDSVARRIQASLQLKANNGLLIIDDLGRQRMAPMELLNRWVVPMEEKQDFLSLGAGRHFRVPFDVTLIFSTNMNPLELADEAFLRRIGHKIYFGYMSEAEYGEIWSQMCAEHKIEFDPQLLHYVINHLHREQRVPLLPCHPRDILGIAVEQSRYQDETGPLSEYRITEAWNSYFVKLSGDVSDHTPGNNLQKGYADV